MEWHYDNNVFKWDDAQARGFFDETAPFIRFIGKDGRPIKDADGEDELVLPTIRCLDHRYFLVHRDGWEHIANQYEYRKAVACDGTGAKNRVKVMAFSDSYVVLFARDA